MELGAAEGHRKDLYSGEHDSRILGDDRFVERLLAKIPPYRHTAFTTAVPFQGN